MIYCISDVHGDYNRYKAMLERIHFSDNDTLYMLGDAIDRGSQGVDVLLDVMSRKNVVFILGNHEMLCLEDLVQHTTRGKEYWRINQGTATRHDLLLKRSPLVRGKILRFLQKAPTFVDLEVKGRKFHLVHGGPAESDIERVWSRPQPGAPAPKPGVTVIVGHTPTPVLTGDNEMPFRIWHGNGIIDIDCGCGHRTPFARLGCLRLDDMREYYL